jgi:hypothetical protein
MTLGHAPAPRAAQLPPRLATHSHNRVCNPREHFCTLNKTGTDGGPLYYWLANATLEPWARAVPCGMFVRRSDVVVINATNPLSAK